MTEEKDLNTFWNKVLSEVQLEVTPMIFGTFFSRTELKDKKTNKIIVRCDDDFIKTNIERKYFEILQEAVNKVNGKETKIKTVIEKIKRGPQTTQETKTDQNLGPLFSRNQEKDHEQLVREKTATAGLSPKFIFENYIMGKSNQLAYAIATAVSDRPGEVYNPVFLYSGVGLGKTHLMQAIGNRILRSKPGTKVLYTTGENFTNELIETLQSGKGKGKYTSNTFRRKFRKADVLLIDDIQFIAGKEATQEEFFHTFNALFMAQKQIVITSDRPPKDFANLEERLTSRFNSGIIADIQPPDLETRMAILRNKRDAQKDPVPNNVLDLIAETVTTNIRELEGAYLQILTRAVTEGETITPEFAAQTLGKTIKEKSSKPVNMNQILNAVCTYYSLNNSDIKGKRRTKNLVIPRQIAMYLIKEITETPYMSIGDFLGGRDHTTVMHGVGKIEGEVKRLGKVKQDISNVKQIIYEE